MRALWFGGVSQLAVLVCATIGATGCLHVNRHSKPATIDGGLTEYSTKSFKDDYAVYTRDISDHKDDDARQKRDSMISLVEVDIESNYRAYVEQLSNTRATIATVGDVTELGRSAAIGVVSGSDVKDLLAASLTGFKGSRLSLDKNFFREKTTEVLISQMEASREAVRAKIIAKTGSLSAETTPQGSISYTYDNASRRATAQVAGQSQIGYTFDNADRLTQIAQGTSTVGFTYDNDDRRSTLTLPNGIVATYSYDNDSHLTGISYNLTSNSIGILNYGYDVLGMRTSVSGSFARTALPQAMPTASYDAANELLSWNESAPTYDANGNMLSDGVHNYAWDARNHLSTIDSGSTGTFIYDSAGRRATKVISGSSTSFLYDLANPVQELSGTTPTANLLTGELDEFFTRTDTIGKVSFLTDAMGGIAALTDMTGTFQTQYIFDPFGNTVQSGNSNTNSLEYTGRESDGTGLYYYRARYYNPATGRFVSEDPIGFASGQTNLYAYVHDDPINRYDPFGLTDYNEQQTLELFLQPAYNDATAGYFHGLWNTFNHSRGNGDYDFGWNEHQNDTFTSCGRKMTAGEFGNYMAGFQTGAWDDGFYGDRQIGFSRNHLWQLRYAEMTARLAGLFYHLVPGQTLAQNDPWDKTGLSVDHPRCG